MSRFCLYAVDVNGGPDQEWYDELADRPLLALRIFARRGHRGLAPKHTAAPRGRDWVCPRCGGPSTLPDLAATLPYRKCGYAEDGPGGVWVHE